MKTKININTLPIGVVLGILAPVLVFFIFYLIKFSQFSVKEFFYILITKNVFVQLISLCVIANLLVFFLFIWTHRYYAARGVIMATFIYTIGVVAYKIAG